MVTIKKAPVKELKKRKARTVKEEEIDYKSLPGVVMFKTEKEWYEFEVYGKLPKGYKG